MEQEAKLLEIVHIAIIIGDHFAEKLYGKFGGGYIQTTEILSIWALEFYDIHKDVDWEYVLDSPTDYNLGENVCCWDDAIVWWCEEKIKNLKLNV